MQPDGNTYLSEKADSPEIYPNVAGRVLIAGEKNSRSLSFRLENI